METKHRRSEQCLAWLTIAALLIAGILLNACNGHSDTPEQVTVSPPPPSSGPTPVFGTVMSIAPDSAAVGSPDVAITVTGVNFDADGHFIRSRIFWSANGTTTLLTSIGGSAADSSTELHGVIPAALISQPGVACVFISRWDPQGDSGFPHPPVPCEPGQQSSTGAPFTVTPAASSMAGRAALGSEAEPAGLMLTYRVIAVPGSTGTRAVGINNRGQVVGRFDGADGVTRGFMRRNDGSYYRFSAPGAVNGTWGQDINDDGVIVGRYFDADFNSHGFVLDHGHFREVAFPGAIETTVRGIRGESRLTGNYVDSVGFETGYIRDRYGFHSVLYPNSDSTDVWDTAPDGLMVGDWSDVAGNIYGYSLRGGQFTNLNVPGSAGVTSIRGINVRHTMVGVFGDASGALHGFARTAAGRYIQFDAPGAQDTYANRINDDGQVVGYYTTADGTDYGYLLTGLESKPPPAAE